ncbi:TonB-dependent receptor domain-containing protein [Halomonas halodenitrificans]|uniref:TonB-dependent receptor domain-containing protein n=1 Tax=Halomonas halodenitrificans TaxID=28252 RepID=UPI00048081A5|nr:TonB-dependent receptor [Halomonas halodenitrificans]
MNTTHATRGLATFALATLPLAVQAAEPQAAETGEPQALNPMVVTAALAPRTADESLSSVTLLDEATLRRQDPTSLTDLFRGQPGVDVNTNGSFGKTSSVSIRGTSSSQSLLMIDGIRLRSATLGGASWQFLDPRMFERAEIVRGPRGSLYGADAMGGVVQLFTPEGEEGEPTPSLSFGGGSFDTQRYSASLSGAEGGTRYYFAASRFDTEGVPVRRDGDDKGYDNTNGLVRLSHTFDNSAEVGLLALRSKGATEFDGGETDFVQQTLGVYGEISISENFHSRLTLSDAKDEQVTPAYSDAYLTETQTARLENTFYLSGHELVIGAEHTEDSVDGSDTGSGAYDIESRYNSAVFAQGLFDFSPVSLQASLRHDSNEAFGDEVTGSLALGYELDTYHTLRASYGTAFRAPSFNDLYFPYTDYGFGFTFEGNPDLKAETSSSVEVGVRGQYSSYFWDFVVYQTDIDNKIVSVGKSVDNVDSAEIKGAELSAGTDIAGWALQAALTYTDAEDSDSGDRLPNIAKRSIRLDLDRSISDFDIGASWLAQSDRIDGFSQERVAGYGIVNLRAGWTFAPMWSARVTVENALDKEYETAKDYINAGRAAFLSVHFGP